MGIYDRDYYKEGSDADRAAKRRQQNSRPAQPQRSRQQPPRPASPPPPPQQSNNPNFYYQPPAAPPSGQQQQPPQQYYYPAPYFPPAVPQRRRRLTIPGWGWIIILICLGSTVIWAASHIDDFTNSASTAAPARSGGKPASMFATPTADWGGPTPTPRPANGAAPASNLPPLGQELVGQSVKANGVTYTVAQIERFNQVGATTTQGEFLMVRFSVSNNGSVPVADVPVNFVDAQGRKFSLSGNTRALTAILSSGQYQSDLSVQPGLGGQMWQLYELPLTATSLKLQPQY